MPTNKSCIAVAILFVFTFACMRVEYRPILPNQIADWHMTANSLSCASPVPAKLNISPDTAKARQACTVQYSGTPNINVTVYTMPDSSTAFEAIQHWEQPDTGKGAFYKGNLFVIVESPSTDLPALARFANLLKPVLSPSAQ